MTDELKDLHDRMRNLVLNTCNKIGCDSCGLEWTENGKSKCSATELQSKILEMEYPNTKTDVCKIKENE